MTRFLCETCGTQFADSDRPPTHCPICEDDRQYVGWNGQRWTTHAALLEQHSARLEDHHGILALGLTPSFAIDQRAFLIPTATGNILWECLSAVTDEAVEAIRARGGIERIAISHPHFYSAMGEWSDAFGGVPITLHEADREWVQRPHSAIEFWSGDTLELADVTLIRCGGHFPGSTVLHWRDGPRPGGALFSGDALQVGLDRRHVSFMYSYPNLVPMLTSDVVAIRERLADIEFDDVFGYTWGRDILGGGRAAVDASMDRFLRRIAG